MFLKENKPSEFKWLSDDYKMRNHVFKGNKFVDKKENASACVLVEWMHTELI